MLLKNNVNNNYFILYYSCSLFKQFFEQSLKTIFAVPTKCYKKMSSFACLLIKLSTVFSCFVPRETPYPTFLSFMRSLYLFINLYSDTEYYIHTNQSLCALKAFICLRNKNKPPLPSFEYL